jgi:molybdopterin-guanine dinucleotide biosynthesis protein A
MSTGAIVLAGGFSRRMGRKKSCLPWGETTLLGHTVAVVQPVVDEVVVVVREGEPLPDIAVRFAHDPVEGLGPLAGLIAGMEALECERVFVTACDVPFLNGALVPMLFGQPGRAVVPVVGGRWMVTTAIYSRSLLDDARRLLAEGERRPRVLAEFAGAHLVEEPELRAVDPDLASFRSCNTPEEYDAARRQA